MTTDYLPERLHHLLIRDVAETGHAPDLARLSMLAGLEEAEAEQALKGLAEMHGVILVPNSCRVWSLHPFALLPTSFWVSTTAGGWWANCAWCSLGIGAALQEDVSIFTSEGAEGQRLEFQVDKGRAAPSGILMHFPYPPAQWWDNPYAPCANILFFSSEANIDAWCARHNHPKGAVLDLQTGIGLAAKWFGDYASPEWHRKTSAQARAIFSDLNLDPSFWTLPAAWT
jgi:hypothetical protein